jgi:hypothetical protein
MTEKKTSQQTEPAPAAEDMLDREYHQIGIAAVAAACRYIHDPAQPNTEAEAHADHKPN